jgi:hypothetical protein
MFVSGVRNSKAFVILSSLINGFYFIAILFSRPHLCFINYLYDLFTTFLSFAFPIICQYLPQNCLYGSTFPSIALGIGAVVIVIALIYDRFLKPTSVHRDESQSLPRTLAMGNDDGSGRFYDCCLDPHEEEMNGPVATINDIDLQAIQGLEADVGINNYGEDIFVNRGRLHHLTSSIMEAFSHAYTQDDLIFVAVGAILAFSVLGGCVGWYVGAATGLHMERLSAHC